MSIDKYLASVKARLAAATFREMKPYTYSPCGYNEGDEAVSLDGKSAINPMPAAFAREIRDALEFASTARTDVDRLVKMVEAARKALKEISSGYDEPIRADAALAALAELDRIAASGDEK